MSNNYDNIANHYDLLSRLVFRRSLIDAQSDLLKFIQPGNHIPIAGGGTGIVLEKISKLHNEGLKITYVDISGKMIALAKKKYTGLNEVHFIHQPVEEFISTQQFDIVMTPFLFDNFTENRISQVFTRLDGLLKPGGKWLFTDFFYDRHQTKLWQSLLLKSMYIFFRVLCNIEAATLIDMEGIFEDNRYQKIHESTFYGGLIKSITYSK